MQQQRPILMPGDRVPNFALPDAESVGRIFYNEVTGGPILLFVSREPEDGETVAALAAFAEAEDRLRELGVECFAVFKTAPEALADSLNRATFTLFADVQGDLVEALLSRQGGKPTGSAMATLAIDPNQRVLARIEAASGSDHAAPALAAFSAWAAAQERPVTLSSIAPVLTLPRVFDEAMCRRLLDAWQADHQEGGVSTGTINLYAPDKKRTLEHFMRDPELNRDVSLLLARRVGSELAKVFQFNRPFRFETHYVLSYRHDRQDFFSVHRDSYRQTEKRRFAMSLNLNEDFEGGALRFPEYGPYLYCPRAGDAVIFSANLLHEALPVTKGQRWTLVSFFCDADTPDQRVPAERRRQMQL